MRFHTLIALSAGLISSTAAVATELEILARAFPNAPDGYAPANTTCPANRPTIRSAAQLSPNESTWLPERRNNTIQAMKDFFEHVNISGFDAVGYINQVSSNATSLPNIGIAVSGGGYRALLNGAGVIKAFDSRTNNSTSPGQLGGLLQSATYVSGLSGGSWLVGSIYINNFTTISALQSDGPGEAWQFDRSIFEGPSQGHSINVLNTAEYFNTVYDQVTAKKNAGYNLTITDIWARFLSFQMINATDGGPNYTWSSIALDPNFQRGNMPMPLVVADIRNPGEKIVGSNSTIVEFSPFEFGSFDPTVYAFAPLEFLGSRYDGGRLPANESCVRGFDNAGFVFGTSSSLFNGFLTSYNTSSLPSVLTALLTGIAKNLGSKNEDIAQYVNPFFNYTQNDGLFAHLTELNLVDGGEDLQNIPLHPLIQPERHVDVIFAVDSSADTSSYWPNGASMVATYERSLNSSGIANGTAFPSVPDENTFINLGLNTRPTFFGCNSSNTTGPTPLIVYLPNFPFVTLSNVSTFDPQYNNTQRDAIILNGYDVATQGNSTSWATCVGCAVLSRSFERTHTTVPAVCNQCFHTYCWNGTVDSRTPSDYEPTMGLTAVNLTGSAFAKVPNTALLVLGAAASMLFLL